MLFATEVDTISEEMKHIWKSRLSSFKVLTYSILFYFLTFWPNAVGDRVIDNYIAWPTEKSTDCMVDFLSVPYNRPPSMDSLWTVPGQFVNRP